MSDDDIPYRGQFVYFTDEAGDAAGVVQARGYIPPPSVRTTAEADLTDESAHRPADDADLSWLRGSAL